MRETVGHSENQRHVERDRQTDQGRPGQSGPQTEALHDPWMPPWGHAEVAAWRGPVVPATGPQRGGLWVKGPAEGGVHRPVKGVVLRAGGGGWEGSRYKQGGARAGRPHL